MKWITKNWPKSTPFLAVYITVLLFIFVMKQNFALFLIWIQFPVYLLHQFEEYIWPGGFIAFFNTKVLGANKDDFPLDENASLWINIPIIYVAFPVSAIMAGQFDLSVGIWTAYFSIINAASHIGMFLKHRYNPGFGVSLFINIPVGIYTVYYFTIGRIIPLNAHIIGILIALAVQGTVMLYGFKVLKPRV